LLEPDLKHPPKAPPSPALLKALAELLLTRHGRDNPDDERRGWR
jgi:hypothetical protein